MPTQKDLKRLVRRRMQKTGESYTSARAQLLRSRNPSPVPTAVAPPVRKRAAKSTVDYAALAGMSDAAVKAATGCDWKKWVGALDYVEAHTWPHRKIAEYLHEKFGVRDWWTQAVTVGYERIRGLREIGQRRGGTFEANRSRTFPVAASVLFDAFAKPRTRARWLNGIKLTVRKATPHRSVRISVDDGSSVEVWLIAKGPGKSAAQIQHRKLPSKDAAAKAKAFWGKRLDALGALLAK